MVSRETRGDAVSESPPSIRSGFRFQSRSAIPPLRFRGGTPSRGSRGFASAPLQPRRGAIPSASSAPKGRHPSAQGSALGTRHTPDSQPRRGAIAGRAVPMDCRYAAPAGLHLALDSIPRAVPWAEEWPRFQRSAASGIRDTSRRKSPPRVKGPVLLAGRGDDRNRSPYGTDLRPSAGRHWTTGLRARYSSRVKGC